MGPILQLHLTAAAQAVRHGRPPVRPLRWLRSRAAACVVVLDARAELEPVVSTIGALVDILDATLDMLQLTDRQHARLRMFIDLERGVAREMRASRRGSRASTRVVVLGGCWAGTRFLERSSAPREPSQMSSDPYPTPRPPLPTHHRRPGRAPGREKCGYGHLSAGLGAVLSRRAAPRDHPTAVPRRRARF